MKEIKFKVGGTIYYNSFGELKSMIVANVVTDSTDNPMYEDKEGNAVFEKDIIEQNPAWSEEDEKMLASFLQKLEVCTLLSNKEYRWANKKLKTIKERVQLQTNSAWSDEDEIRFESTLHRMEIVGNGCAFGQLKDDIEWFKSLKERCTWKPSNGHYELEE